MKAAVSSRSIVVAVGAFICLAAPATAAGGDNCVAPADQATMTECAGAASVEADRELNRVYDQLLARVPKEDVGLTRDAQRAWVAFRDKECTSRTGGGPNQGGTIWPAIYAQCEAALTRERTRDLKAQVKCPGGDLSCPP